MATLREWFDDEKVDWASLVMICHTMADGSYSPGWATPAEAVRFEYATTSVGYSRQ
jgi:hypothetical protein